MEGLLRKQIWEVELKRILEQGKTSKSIRRRVQSGTQKICFGVANRKEGRGESYGMCVEVSPLSSPESPDLEDVCKSFSVWEKATETGEEVAFELR